jgi:hypothetical protein
VGLEAECNFTVGDREATGKVRLEPGELTIRGEVKLKVPLSSLEHAGVEDGQLVLQSQGRSVKLRLGEVVAARWLDKIKNPKSRLQKLGVKPHHKVLVWNLRDAEFLAELDALDNDLVVDGLRGDNDLLFLGAQTQAELDRFADARRSIRQDGAVWLVRPKGGKTITEAEGMRAGQQAGLVDVKVVAFSASHTAEKFVIRVADRR